MSYDFAVWHSVLPMSLAEAHGRIARFENPNVETTPNPNVVAFVEALIAEYPRLEDLSDDEVDDAPWSVSPEVSGDGTYLCVTYSRAAEFAERLLVMAEEYDLVVFNRQTQELKNPSSKVSLVLTIEHRAPLENPTIEQVGASLRNLGPQTSTFAILDRREPETYIQVLTRTTREYTVEYRDGGPDAHFVSTTTDINQVIRLFERFFVSGVSGLTGVSWSRLNFQSPSDTT